MGRRDAQARGVAFEELTEQLFGRAGFRVARNAGAARPRQTDLHVKRGQREYLVEVKWRSRPIERAAIVDFRDRLVRVPHRIAGVFLSMSGFSKDAVEEAEASRPREMLLVDRAEIEQLAGGGSLLDLLDRKHEALSRDGRVWFAPADPWEHRWEDAPVRTLLPRANATLWHPELGEVPWVQGRGAFGPIIFVQDLPDVDWTTAQGAGVGLDLDLPFEDEDDIPRLLEAIRESVGLSSAGRFSIQQAETCWFGAGATALLEALERRRDRYAALASGTRLHHTEEITYFDVSWYGLLTLQADVAADDSGRLRRAGLSMQLRGLPVDIEPFRDLCHRFGVTENAYFRPLAERPVKTSGCGPGDRVRLDVHGYLCSHERHETWVTGIIAVNPVYCDPDKLLRVFRRDDGLFDPVCRFEYFLCDLGHHHELGYQVDHYYLRFVEGTWTADALVVRPVADWDEASTKT